MEQSILSITRTSDLKSLTMIQRKVYHRRRRRRRRRHSVIQNFFHTL